LAKAATDQVIQRPGQISPLVLFGPVGSGKTHLATGLGQHLRRKQANYSVLQLSAEQFTTRFLQALNGSGLPSLRSQFRDVDLLILEDVQFFQGKKATLVELQHTIDSLLRMGKQLILTTDRHPNDLTFLSSEIQTRLVSGLVIPLQLPDREARMAICQRWCEQWRLTMATGMIEWLADHIAGDTRRLSGAMFRLLATQSSRGSLVQPYEAMEILSDYAITQGQLCSLSMIQKAVCSLCGIEPAELNGSLRTRKISGARMLAMYLARKHTPAALAEIGEFFGGRRHSTVVAAEKRIRAGVQKNENLETAARPLNLREAIRKVETQLKTG
jgi:chromosomal replication initiator protein